MSTGKEPSFDANLSERRRILMTMLDAVYVDPVGEKSIFSIQPKPAFRPLFEMATTREGSDVVLIKEPPQATNEPEATDSCSWWRRGRVELAREHGWALLVALSWGAAGPASALLRFR